MRFLKFSGIMSSDNRTNDVTDSGKDKLNIIIVGGSLGGLTAGIALKRLGHHVTILERNPTPLLDNQGAGIVVGDDLLAFFKKYDRCGRDIAVSSQCRQYMDNRGRIMHKVDRAQNMTSWDLVYHMLRANFDGVRSEYCRVPEPLEEDGPVVHLHGHTVKGAVVKGDKVEVMWKSAKGKEGSTLADFVVAADGPSSTIRDSLIPTVNRMYAGYCALRGTVPESDLSVSTREAFCERFTFFHAQGIQVLAYLIPGESGALEPGKRLINFVYYTNFPAKSLDEPSPELAELMTDVHGVQHRISMPPGKIDLKAWEKQLQIAKKILPPPFVELVSVTKKPFVQAITDVLSPENELMGGKVVLVGDALAGFRPHTAASTSQAAFDAMILADMIAGKVSREEWKRKTMEYARTVQKRGVEMGDRSQFEKLPPERYFG